LKPLLDTFVAFPTYTVRETQTVSAHGQMKLTISLGSYRHTGSIA